MKALYIALALLHIIPSTQMYEYHPIGLYVTYDTGIVLNEKGDGLITTVGADSYYNYIKYKEGTEVGTEVFTLCVYNPLSIYGDDIIARFDF